MVFTNVHVNTLISIIQNSPNNNVLVRIFDTLGFHYPPKEEHIYPQLQFVQSNHTINIFENETDSEVLGKISTLSSNIHPFYLLSIINSGFIAWYHLKRDPKAQKGLFPKVLVSDLKNIPIRRISFTTPADRRAALVEQAKALYSNDPAFKCGDIVGAPDADNLDRINRIDRINASVGKLTPLLNRIEATDRLIDQIVYKLYGLTQDEIKIVEGSISGEKNAEGSKT